jgi:nickel-dependent lactate racemase
LTNLSVGLQTWSIDIPAEKAVAVRRRPFTEPDKTPKELVREALEAPFQFEPLRRALTPDDHLAIVLDAELPHAAELIAGVLEHVATAGIAPAAVTVVTPPGSRQDWIDELPDEFADVTAETHDPADRKKLAYLASTRSGRRVYLNRTLVEADFTVVLSGRRFDPVRAYAGAEVALYPEMADEEVRAANAGPYTKQSPWEGREESQEVTWLLGTPFFVQVIEGEGDTVQEVVAGIIDSSDEGRRRQDAHWKWQMDAKADIAIAAISGDPARIAFLDLAKAAAGAARSVKKGGRIALLTAAAPPLGEAAEMIRSLDAPKMPESRLANDKPADWPACKLWCFAAAHASIFLASGYPDELVEELFATPIASAAEVQRLVDAAETVVTIPDAHKAKLQVRNDMKADG